MVVAINPRRWRFSHPTTSAKPDKFVRRDKMRKLIITVGFSKYPTRMADQFDTIFYGRYTYETLRKYQAMAYDRQHNMPMAAVEQMRKYVFSKTVKHVPGNGMIIGDNLLWEVNRIKDEEGKSIWLFGGASIIESFLQQHLVDECWIAGKSGSTFRKFIELEAVNTRQPLVYESTVSETAGAPIHLYKPIYK